MWALDKDDEATKQVIQDAISNNNNYVLKTQREGGGHNYFGADIATQLQKENELWKYSLMKRINPISFPAILMRNEKIWAGNSVSELGIFGTIIAKNLPQDESRTRECFEVLTNKEVGCMMRTKPKNVDEGGVNAGYAFVDNPYLVDEDSLTVNLKFP